MYSALSVLLRWAVQQRKITISPAVGVWRPGAPPSRERVLDEREIRWFWQGCKQIGSPFGPLFQLLLLTGARLGEVSGMTRAELSEDQDVWTVPGARASRSPNACTAFIPAVEPGARTTCRRIKDRE